jgi:methyl-accepting chemotaxis protein
LSRLTESQFTEISQIAQDYHAIIREVETASRQSTQGLEQVNEAIARVDGITKRSAAVAEENAAATVELTAQAENVFLSAARLHEMVRSPADGKHPPSERVAGPPPPTVAGRPRPVRKPAELTVA